MNTIDRVLRISLALGALLGGMGIFYHYVIYIPELENQKEKLAVQEKREAADREEKQKYDGIEQEASRRREYEKCLDSAKESYPTLWAEACAEYARRQSKGLKDCMSSKAHEDKSWQWCEATFVVDKSPTCGLPRDLSEAIDSAIKDAQQKCLGITMISR